MTVDPSDARNRGPFTMLAQPAMTRSTGWLLALLGLGLAMGIAVTAFALRRVPPAVAIIIVVGATLVLFALVTTSLWGTWVTVGRDGVLLRRWWRAPRWVPFAELREVEETADRQGLRLVLEAGNAITINTNLSFQERAADRAGASQSYIESCHELRRRLTAGLERQPTERNLTRSDRARRALAAGPGGTERRYRTAASLATDDLTALLAGWTTPAGERAAAALLLRERDVRVDAPRDLANRRLQAFLARVADPAEDPVALASELPELERPGGRVSPR